MRLPILLFGALICTGTVLADDVATSQKLVERKTCAQIKTELDNLLFIVNPDEATQKTIKELQALQRSNCVPKSAGRRKVMRNVPSATTQPKTNIDTVAATSDALSEYLANKKSNCEKLNSEITKMDAMNDESKSDALTAMHGVYNMDCAEKSEPKPETSELTVEEWAAAYDANLAAGLCGDGTKPNQYGCCTDETFRDMGKAVFACCPKTGGDCFPPIK